MKFWWPLFLAMKFISLILNLAKIHIFIPNCTKGGSTCLMNIPKKYFFCASLVSGYEKTLFLSIESVSQTFWVVSKCVDYVENTHVLKLNLNLRTFLLDNTK